MRPFKPRYSLATLLTVVTAIGLLLWGVPEWREYRRRMEFERTACQLTEGYDTDVLRLISPFSAAQDSISYSVFRDVDGNNFAAVPVFYKHYWYSICAQTESVGAVEIGRVQRERLEAIQSGNATEWVMPGSKRWRNIRVYRLRPMPPGYEPQSREVRMRPNADRTYRNHYLRDFYEFIAGREPRNFGFEYELIHADPPLLAN